MNSFDFFYWQSFGFGYGVVYGVLEFYFKFLDGAWQTQIFFFQYKIIHLCT